MRLNRLLGLLLALALGLQGCGGAAGSLWGAAPSAPTLAPTYQPPTPIPTPTPFQPVFPTPVPLPTATAVQTPVVPAGENPPLVYYTQPGDWLPAVAARFGVSLDRIRSETPLSSSGFLPPETLLLIPPALEETGPGGFMLPDSELIAGPSTVGFDPAAYVTQSGGYLSDYQEYLGSTGWTTGAEAVRRIARENSINPRLLLGLIDYESGWVRGQPTNIAQEDYPLHHLDYYYRGLFRQMMWAVEELSLGYYGWRAGSLTEVTTTDGVTVRLAPTLNAGTAALQYYFAQTRTYEEWLRVVDPETGFAAFYAAMFGDPWERAATVEPLYPPNLTQPPMVLPFGVGESWSLTGGPHAAWEKRGALAALDFAPPSAVQGCSVSDKWVHAIAPGLVVREEKGVLVIDMDGDGHEETGWVVLYLHVSSQERAVHLGDWVNAGDLLGHPSCEGGVSTGTHVHIARKFNGEWMLADGPVPFNLSGWVAHNGAAPYKGTMTRGDQVIYASQYGSYESRILNDE